MISIVSGSSVGWNGASSSTYQGALADMSVSQERHLSIQSSESMQ